MKAAHWQASSPVNTALTAVGARPSTGGGYTAGACRLACTDQFRDAVRCYLLRPRPTELS